MSSSLPRIADDEYLETERRLRQWFRDQRRLEHVEDMLMDARDEQEGIRKRLSSGIEVVTPYPSVRLSSSPPAQSEPTSPLERAVEYADDVRAKMEGRLVTVTERIARLEVERGELAERVAEVRAATDLLDAEHADVLAEHYGQRRRVYQIAYDLHCSQATVRRRLSALVRTVSLELGIATRPNLSDN